MDSFDRKVKFIYSEKATKFCEISTLLLSICTEDKSKVEILQNFVAFSEYWILNLDIFDLLQNLLLLMLHLGLWEGLGLIDRVGGSLVSLEK